MEFFSISHIVSFFILLLFSWFLENVNHENSHRLVAKYQLGATIISFKPYPHWYLDDEGGAQRCFARVEFKDSIYIPPFFYLISLLSAVFFFVFFMFIFWFFLYLFGGVYASLVIPFVVSPFVDAVHWLWGAYRGSNRCDGRKYRATVRALLGKDDNSKKFTW